MTTMSLPTAAAGALTLDADARYKDLALWIYENSALHNRREIALAAPVFDPEILEIGRQIAASLASISTQKVVLVNLDQRLDPSPDRARLTLQDALTVLSADRPPLPLTACSAFDVVSSSSLKLASEQLLDRFDFVVWVMPPLLEGLRGVVAARVIGQVCLALRSGDSTISQLKRIHAVATEEQFEIATSILRETRRYLPRWVDRWLPAR